MVPWRETRDGGPRSKPARLAGSALVGGLFHPRNQALFHLALGAHHIRDEGKGGVHDRSITAIAALLNVLGWTTADRSRRAASA